MFKNYLKTALRNLSRNKIYSIITIIGLAVGMVCALFILVFAKQELGYDRFHQNIKSIYQVLVHTDVQNNPSTPTALAPLLKEDYPEIIEASRYHWFWGETILKYNDQVFNESGIRFVDPGFLNIFNFSLIKGDVKTAFVDPFSIVMTRETAEKYFGEEDPIGKIVILNDEYPLTVTGVVENIPMNSSMKFDMLMPIQFNINIKKKWYTSWGNLFVYTFIKCKDNISTESLNEKIEGIIQEQGGQENATLELLPFKDRYFFFYSDKTTVIVFLTVAAFILLIAAFNFINLSIALSIRRAKEIGMRKTLGASKSQVVIQYLGESVLLSFIAGIFTILLFYLLIPVFHKITGGNVQINFSFVFLSAFAITILTGVVAGLYPAFFLSSFKISHIMKGEKGNGLKGNLLRKGIVVFQFSLSVILILAMIIVYQQVHFIQTKDLGYQKEDIVCIPMGGGSEKFYKTFKTELLNKAGIVNVTGTGMAFPIFDWRINAFKWEGKDPDENISINFNSIDYDLIETLDIKLIDGRNMSASRDYASDEGSVVYINKKMAELMQLKDVVGTIIMQGDAKLKVVGVVDNFNFTSLRNQIEPLILDLFPDGVDNVLIRIRPENKEETLANIQKVWDEIIEGYPFKYSFLDEDYNQSKTLTTLSRTVYLLSSFAILAIIISCLGLFALSAFIAEQSTQEIGIRKVHGASVINIASLLFNKFKRSIIIANLISWPVAYYFISKWLQDFAFCIDITIWPFLIAGVSLFLIAVLTVSWQTIKAANLNPADSLRYE